MKLLSSSTETQIFNFYLPSPILSKTEEAKCATHSVRGALDVVLIL